MDLLTISVIWQHFNESNLFLSTLQILSLEEGNGKVNASETVLKL